ncbi:Oidioi.mRNA.OKI2018_I69.PAR.g10469.t1.cds [Oikopleura dioica]|uniref:Oidioi.mRNA.OKI2018_I69.PAR.g10469.t1.cds n=1 Tax=Oikopleura dioica TaxID=34765 RepID=A0ABN7RTV6_OIKDI|nr:Oidioi.mRNA.OKI2018_I69.PAR.g10469.t1.cds [Oikopleura dioica]
MMLLLADPSSNNNALSFIFIILNGLQGVFIFIFYVLLREDVLKTMGFAIKPRKEKPTITQKRSGLTDSSILDQTPSTEIPEEKFFQAISQKSSSNISTKPIGNSPKLLRNRHVFWKSPTIRPDTADGPRGKSERQPPEAGQNLMTEKRTVKTTTSLPTFGSSKDPAIEDFRR